MRIIQRLKESYALHMAVKEALDSLPAAVCYFNASGGVKLCNTAMRRLYGLLTMGELQCFEELKRALQDSVAAGTLTQEGALYLFPDGRVMQYSVKYIRTADGRAYTEAVFSDVSELYRKRQELQRQSIELKLMYREMELLSEHVREATREREILSFKKRLHDQMNMGIAAVRQILRTKAAPEDDAVAVEKFRRAVLVLQEEGSNPQDELTEFFRDAQVSGICVEVSGELPKDKNTLRLLAVLFREACVNAAKHADATRLSILCRSTHQELMLQLTNDGRPPEGAVQPVGGLAYLNSTVEKAGGRMEIQSRPEFMLTVVLPLSGEREEEKG